MKRTGLLLFAFAAMAIAFGGCSKDDDDDFSIVGTWQQESFSLTVDFGIPGMDPMVIDEDDDEDVTITFNDDGTGYSSDSEGTESFNWTLSGNQLTISDVDMSLTLTLTTMTNSRVVGEQSLTAEEMADMFEIDDEDFDMFPNMTASMKIVLVK